MKLLNLILLIGCLLLPNELSVLAKGGGGHGGHSGGQGTVHVSSYYRHDGTFVNSYYRSTPGTAVGYSSVVGISSGSYGSESTPSYSAPAVYVPPRDPVKEAAVKAETAQRVLKWHQGLADKGHIHGEYSMGLRYLRGDGVERNEELGRAWLTKAAKQGHDEAYKTLKNTDYFETKRDENGRIVRSSTARQEFMTQTGFPHGRSGYVIDHIVPLKRGGADSPSNMQWQTTAEAKAKDKWE